MGATGIMADIVAALPFTTPQYEVRVERDVVYAEAHGFWASADEEAGHRLHIGPDGNFTPLFFEIQDRMAAFLRRRCNF